MAKSKFKFDSKAIQAWFNLHVEKIAMVVCFCVFVWMAWSACSTKSFDRKPEDLSKLVVNTKRTIEETKWQPAQEEIKLPDPPYADQVALALQPLDAKPFEWPTLFNVPLFENKQRRGEPKFLTARDLKASFSQGALQMQGEKSISGMHWIAITGLIPVREQQSEHDKQFKNGVIPWKLDRDSPRYVDFVVERSEVMPGKEGAPTWVKLDLDEAHRIATTLAATRPEVVDGGAVERYTEAEILYKVPPLVEPAPNEIYAHPPEITLSAQGPKVEAAPVAAPVAQRRPAGAVAPKVEAKAAPAAANAEAKPEPVLDYRLYRFCDYTVQRGKSYMYRVKLVLENANYQMEPFNLEKPEMATGPTRETEFSAPSNAVSVPIDFQVAAIDARPPVSVQDAMARFMTIRFSDRFGVLVGQTFGKFDGDQKDRGFERGTRISFGSIDTKVRKAGGAVLTNGQVDFPLNAVLAGISGGDSRGRQTKAPAELMCFWPDGHMTLHNQLGESLLVDALDNGKPLVDQWAADNPNRPKVEPAAAAAADPKAAPGKAPPAAKAPTKLEDLLKAPPKK